MGSVVGFICGNEDHKMLQTYAESIGLKAIAPVINQPLKENPADGAWCYLLPISHTELHPYGEPKIKLADVKDPLLFFMRGYYKKPYLVVGQIHWNNDVPDLAVETKPYFNKLSKWIKSNWKLPLGEDFYIGPEAEFLIEKGAEIVNAIPGTAEFQIVHY